jgi:hypothetical protein
LDVGDEYGGVVEDDVALDPPHIGKRDLVAAGELGLQQLGDAGDAVTNRIAGRQIVDPAARAQLVERVVVERRPDRIVVGAGDEPLACVDDLRHLREGEDLVAERLIGRRGWIGDPAVGQRAGPVADEVRRQARDRLRLQILAQRQLRARPVGDVALDVGDAPVL